MKDEEFQKSDHPTIDRGESWYHVCKAGNGRGSPVSYENAV